MENTQKVRDSLQRAPSNREQAEAMGWIDANYHEANPWHGQSKKKPVFSLGKPLPRVTRWPKESGNAAITTRPPVKSSEDLAELGEAVSRTEPNAEKEASTAEGGSSKKRRTAAGVSHGDRRNDAGLPVFEYQPRDDSTTRRERTNDTADTKKSNRSNPNFGIDSEPIGQREHNDVEEGEKDPNELRNWWARVRAKHPEPLAEFLAVRFPRPLAYLMV